MLSPPMGERVHQDANGEVYCHGDQVTCYVRPVNNGHSDYSHHSRSGLSRPKFCKISSCPTRASVSSGGSFCYEVPEIGIMKLEAINDRWSKS